MARAVVISVLFHVAHVLAYFISAGAPAMSAGPVACAAWAVFGSYAFASLVMFLFGDRGLIAERSSARPGIKRVDVALASAAHLLTWPGALLVAGLDARFGWTAGSSLALRGIGFGVFLSGLSFATWAMLVNRFFSTFVRIQTERGHAVVSHGPYSLVRHPGYAGTIAMGLSIPFALSSIPALIPGVLGAIVYVIRTAVEDDTLQRELPGYQAYASRVRFRLFPAVWECRPRRQVMDLARAKTFCALHFGHRRVSHGR